MLQAQAPPPAPGLTGEAAVAAAVAGLEQRQTLQGLTQALRTLQTNLKVADGVKAQVDKLAAEATSLQNAGNGGEARRLLLHAIALQRGLPWDEKVEFGGSLVLNTTMTVTDSSRPFYAQLTQKYSAPYAAPSGLRLRVTIADFAAPGKVLRDLGTFDAYNLFRPTRNWADWDYELSKKMTAVLIAFANTGNPSTPEVKWPAWTAENESYVNFGDPITLATVNRTRLDWMAKHRPPPGARGGRGARD
jgi:hypothetical protein